MTELLTPTRTIYVHCGSALMKSCEAESHGVAALKDYLLEVVHDILCDHDIKAQYKVEIGKNEMGVRELQISIEDREVRVVRQGSILSWREEKDLAAQIAESIFANRALLLPPDIVQHLWGEWVGNGETYPAGFSKLLDTLMFRGVRITRLEAMREKLRACAWGEEDVRDLFELTLARISGQRMRIMVSQDHYDQLYERNGEARALSEEYGSIEWMLRMMSDGLFYELGIVYRLDEIETDDALQGAEIRFKVNDLRTPIVRGLQSNEFLVNDTASRLAYLNVTARFAVNPASGSEAAVVEDVHNAKTICEDAVLTTWDNHGCMILMASHVIRRFAGALLTTGVVEFMLERVAMAFPALVSRVQELYDVRRLTQILRNLIDEEISIRDIRSIFECLAAFQGPVEVDLSRYIVFLASPGMVATKMNTQLDGTPGGLELSECARNWLKRYISHKYTRGSNTLFVYLADPVIEGRLRKPAPLDSMERRALTAAVEGEVGNLPLAAQKPVILTTAEVRARLRREIEKEYSRLAVLSYQELIPDMNIQPIARISWSESGVA